MSYAPLLLHTFQSQPPKYHSGQDSILEWIAAAHAQAEITLQKPVTDEAREIITRKYRKLVLRFGCSTDRIHFRNSALEDFTHTDWDRMRIFQLKEYPSGKPCGERSRFFREVSGLAFDRFYAEEADPPPVLIHVTCTGYVSPSGAQRLVAKRDWRRATEVIHAYHMGCYASLPAVRMAAGFVERGKARVDLVHTELCTLHMDPTQHLPEHLVVQTLFADGVIKYSASRMGDGASVSNGLELLATREEIVPNTEDAMSWMVSDFGMLMTLSRKVPDHIRAGLGAFLDRLGANAGLTTAQLCETALFAIHPGGPRIIDEIAEHLGLRPEQVQASNAILGAFGNMSSATLPHVWKAILEDVSVPPGTMIVSLAFGPGLTISGALLRKHG
ncbi:3-oxoacyl-[acyl-carrier-protein] synthase III C-terminal domain-containing protein [Geothrix fuzhouensis]|uniref:3-oxoacyl-[acyl-carrier-protein] synthase III C-terminal domain-containing protein n=1 Tax=Geothrix fuzhouensis TaxID=2966451 RepID=UPI0021475153|nr:3-oxoacyl-[acyl-carrier-protein] synthase III C-terminal domain-containing protein [Geothrix fuzhouensis]